MALLAAVCLVVLQGCNGFTGDPPSSLAVLVGTTWQAQFVGGTAPVPGYVPTIEFAADRVTGSAGCNGYSSQQLRLGAGDFERGMAIELGEIAGNAALCQDQAAMDLEAHFIEILAEVNQVRFDGDLLILEGLQGRLRFVPPDLGTYEDGSGSARVKPVWGSAGSGG